MKKITSANELQYLRQQGREKAREENSNGIVQVRVALATCGVASGAKDIYDFLKDELVKRNIEANVLQTGCMGYCYAEPTVEVQLPGYPPIIFGDVNQEKADRIIEKYIRNRELVDGIIPVNYEQIDQA